MSTVMRTVSQLLVALLLFVWSLLNAVTNTIELRANGMPESVVQWGSIALSFAIFSLLPLTVAGWMLLRMLPAPPAMESEIIDGKSAKKSKQ